LSEHAEIHAARQPGEGRGGRDADAVARAEGLRQRFVGLAGFFDQRSGTVPRKLAGLNLLPGLQHLVADLAQLRNIGLFLVGFPNQVAVALQVFDHGALEDRHIAVADVDEMPRSFVGARLIGRGVGQARMLLLELQAGKQLGRLRRKILLLGQFAQVRRLGLFFVRVQVASEAVDLGLERGECRGHSLDGLLAGEFLADRVLDFPQGGVLRLGALANIARQQQVVGDRRRQTRGRVRTRTGTLGPQLRSALACGAISGLSRLARLFLGLAGRIVRRSGLFLGGLTFRRLLRRVLRGGTFTLLVGEQRRLDHPVERARRAAGSGGKLRKPAQDGRLLVRLIGLRGLVVGRGLVVFRGLVLGGRFIVAVVGGRLLAISRVFVIGGRLFIGRSFRVGRLLLIIPRLLIVRLLLIGRSALVPALRFREIERREQVPLVLVLLVMLFDFLLGHGLFVVELGVVGDEILKRRLLGNFETGRR